MDNFDRAILRIVQEDCSQGYEAISRQVGLSASAVRRRLINLRRTGVIMAERAILDSSHIGVTLILSVSLAQEDTAAYRYFKAKFSKMPEITQCYIVTGQADFIIIAHLNRMEDYESWLDRHLLCEPLIKRIETSVVYSRAKFNTAIPTAALQLPN